MTILVTEKIYLNLNSGVRVISCFNTNKIMNIRKISILILLTFTQYFSSAQCNFDSSQCNDSIRLKLIKKDFLFDNFINERYFYGPEYGYTYISAIPGAFTNMNNPYMIDFSISVFLYSKSKFRKFRPTSVYIGLSDSSGFELKTLSKFSSIKYITGNDEVFSFLINIRTFNILLHKQVAKISVIDDISNTYLNITPDSIEFQREIGCIRSLIPTAGQ
jgi:hypothetical protein